MSAEAVHYSIHDAKTHLSRIIERVERGEEIIIDRAGTPVAKVVPLVRLTNRTAIGSLAGQVDLSGLRRAIGVIVESPQPVPLLPESVSMPEMGNQV
jgi:prevent-host-death family protein